MTLTRKMLNMMKVIMIHVKIKEKEDETSIPENC